MKITPIILAAALATLDAASVKSAQHLRAGSVLHPRAVDLALEQHLGEGGRNVDRARSSEDVSWQKAGLAGAGAFTIGALAAAGAVYFALKKKEEKKEVETQDEAETHDETSKAAVPSKEADTAAPAAADDAVPTDDDAEGIDYEQMVKLLSQRLAQLYGPKLAKAQAVKQICEDRATGFVGKAKQLFLNEINSTTGAVMKEVGSEEAMLLLDFDSTVGSYFPSLTVLLAGIMSPTVLMLSFYNHVVQVIVVHLPMVVLCAWAAFEDRAAACGGIPTLHAWVYSQGVVAATLAVGNLAVAAQIKGGQATIRAKTEEMLFKLQEKRKQKPDDMALDDVRELFICNSVLLQQALLAEERVRRSGCNLLIGVLTVLSCFMTLWTLVLCIGWATVPGQIAMHPDAKAVVAPEEFCGAWASIIAIRVVMMLSVLFLIFNLASIARWVAENLLHSTSFRSGMIDKAKKMDDSHTGLPVAQTLVKTFLLRGKPDMVSSQVSLAGDKMANLEKERAEQQNKLDALQKEIDARESELVAIEGQDAAKKEDDAEKMRASLETLEKLENMDMTSASDELKAQAAALKAVAEQGALTAEEAKAKAAEVETYTKEQLEKMFAKFQDLLVQAKDSDVAKAAMEKSQAAVEQAKQKATEVHGQVQQVDVQAAVEQARQKAAEVAEQAQEAAEKARGK